jgi:hypothetical protein
VSFTARYLHNMRADPLPYCSAGHVRPAGGKRGACSHLRYYEPGSQAGDQASEWRVGDT